MQQDAPKATRPPLHRAGEVEHSSGQTAYMEKKNFAVSSSVSHSRRSQRAMLRVLCKQRGPNPRRMVKTLRVRHKSGRTVFMSKVWALCRQHGDSQKP